MQNENSRKQKGKNKQANKQPCNYVTTKHAPFHY